MSVKMVKTTMPRDMKAAKAERTQAVAEQRKAHKAVQKAQARKDAKAARDGGAPAGGGLRGGKTKKAGAGGKAGVTRA